MLVSHGVGNPLRNPVGRLENWSLNHSECGMLMATVTLAGDVGSWELESLLI